MNKEELIEACLALFPEAEMIWGREMLLRDLDLAMRVTAVHCVSEGIQSGESFDCLRQYIIATHGVKVTQAKDARKKAEAEARTEAIRASIRQKKTNIRRGRPGDHGLTPEESEQELMDSKR